MTTWGRLCRLAERERITASLQKGVMLSMCSTDRSRKLSPETIRNSRSDSPPKHLGHIETALKNYLELGVRLLEVSVQIYGLAVIRSSDVQRVREPRFLVSLSSWFGTAASDNHHCSSCSEEQRRCKLD